MSSSRCDKLVGRAQLRFPNNICLLLTLNPDIAIFYMNRTTRIWRKLFDGDGASHIEKQRLCGYALQGYVPSCVFSMDYIEAASEDQVLVILSYRTLVVFADNLQIRKTGWFQFQVTTVLVIIRVEHLQRCGRLLEVVLFVAVIVWCCIPPFWKSHAAHMYFHISVASTFEENTTSWGLDGQLVSWKRIAFIHVVVIKTEDKY